MREAAPISEAIRLQLPSLTRSEQRAARALLAEYPLAGLEPLARLSRRAGVSDPTVLRLISKLGFDGYPAFQQLLREEVQIRIGSPSSRLTVGMASGPAPGTVEDPLNSLLHSMKETIDGLPRSEFDRATELLVNRRASVTVLGGLVSWVLASHLTSRLRQLRPNVQLAYGPGHDGGFLDRALDLRRNDVVVAFDFRRYQRTTVEFLRVAAAHRAKIVLLTDNLHLCPALDVADVVLPFATSGPPPFDSPIGGFAIAEALASSVASRLGAASRIRMQDLEAIDQDWMWDRSLIPTAARRTSARRIGRLQSQISPGIGRRPGESSQLPSRAGNALVSVSASKAPSLKGPMSTSRASTREPSPAYNPERRVNGVDIQPRAMHGQGPHDPEV